MSIPQCLKILKHMYIGVNYLSGQYVNLWPQPKEIYMTENQVYAYVPSALFS